jgi:ABC-type bacteriocin/lantibiotic exporter with double-glycine peptidase domain
VKHILRHTLAVLDKKEKTQFTFLTILDVIINIIDILFLALLLWMIQFYIQPNQSIRLSFLPHWIADKNSVLFIAIFFFLFGIKNIAGFFIARAQYKFISRVAVRISRNNLLNYQQAKFEEFINIDSSAYIRKISIQPFDFCQHLLSGIQQIITQLFLVAITIIAIILFNAKLFLFLLLVLLPPVVPVFYFIKKRLTNAKKQIQSTNERSFQYLLDALKGYVEANIYDRNDFFMKRFINVRKKFSRYLFDSLSIQTLPTRIIEIFAVLGLFILIAIAKWTGNNDSGSLLTIGAFMAAAYKIIPGIVKLINISGQMKAYEFAINEPDSYRVVENKERKKNNIEKTFSSIETLEFKNINFKYPTQPVLNDFSFVLKKGDFAGITGESGKGKTTILNLLLGFLTEANGEIIINGLPVDSQERKKYWPQISYVRQQSFFIHDTVLRNIVLEEDGYHNENLQYAMKVSGLDEFITKFPEGLDKVITENGKNISGGQQQRVALARAIYKNAGLILLDEPFNELDEASVMSMLEYFRELSSKGKIIIMITHDKQSLSYCNKIISLDEQR